MTECVVAKTMPCAALIWARESGRGGPSWSLSKALLRCPAGAIASGADRTKRRFDA
jgi:hypothetical protein